MEKIHLIAFLYDVIGNLTFKDRLPQRYKGDKTKIQVLVDYYKKTIITPSVITNVINDLAFSDVLEKVRYDESKYKDEVKLSQITEIDRRIIATKADKILSSLPLYYQFILRLPKCETPIGDLKLAYNMEILSASDSLIKHLYGEKNTYKKLRSNIFDLISSRQKISKGDLILKVGGKGYVSEFGAVKLDIIDPLYVWKVIIGVYAGLEIIKRQDKIAYIRLPQEFTYSVYLDTGEQIRSFNESTEDNQYISKMQFDPNAFKPSQIDILLKKTNTPFDYTNNVLVNLFSVIRFAKGKTDKNVVKQQIMIKNGAYWFYESLKTQQDHVRVIYMTTAFDSLLAAKGAEDTKENKAELIAISVSKDSLEADIIRQTIIELYAFRNEIVHGSWEISSLDQYSDWEGKPTRTNNYYSLSILMRFLRSRIYFINGGLSRVNRLINRT